MLILLLFSFFLSLSINGMDVSQLPPVSSSSSSTLLSASAVEYIKADNTTTYMPTGLTITTENKQLNNNKKWVSLNTLTWSLLIARKNQNDKGINPGQLHDALIQRKIDDETLVSHSVVVYCAREGEKPKMECMVYSIACGQLCLSDECNPILLKSALPDKTMYLAYGEAFLVNSQRTPLDKTKVIQESPFRYKPQKK